MRVKRLITSMVTAGALIPAIASAEFMDAKWASQACDAWNQSERLTTELAGDVWMDNNGGRGYKLVQMFRTACGEQTKVQLTIEAKDGKAICTYGGEPDGRDFDPKMDYMMHAKDKHWNCIGAGKFGCGAMGAMSTGKLRFKGPKMEAMGVMGPFGSFLKLTGAVPGSKTPCSKN